VDIHSNICHFGNLLVVSYAFCVLLCSVCDYILSIHNNAFVFNVAEKEFSDMKLDELNELEDEIDEEDERIFEAYRSYG